MNTTKIKKKTIKQMYKFICDKAEKQKIGNVAMISDQMIYLWAVIYFSKSNEELGIKENKKVMPPSADEVIKNIEKKKAKKENEKAKCPNCKNRYLIKRSNLKYYDFKDYLSILDYIDDTFVIRYFELKTIIDANHNSNYSVVEFAREFPTDNYYRYIYVNDRVAKCQCHIYIYHHDGHYIDVTKWRAYTYT